MDLIVEKDIENVPKNFDKQIGQKRMTLLNSEEIPQKSKI